MGDLEFALDLMRRLPPANVEQNLYNLCDMVPDMMSDLLGSVDQPLKIAHDSKHRKDYLLCDYNRDGDSYRYVLRGEEPLKACRRRWLNETRSCRRVGKFFGQLLSFLD